MTSRLRPFAVAARPSCSRLDIIRTTPSLYQLIIERRWSDACYSRQWLHVWDSQRPLRCFPYYIIRP